MHYFKIKLFNCLTVFLFYFLESSGTGSSTLKSEPTDCPMTLGRKVDWDMVEGVRVVKI